MSSLKGRPKYGLVKIIDYCSPKSGFEIKIALPAKYEICERCRGEGHHSNPAIDGNGITASEFAEWDPDEIEGYFRGDYDIRCEERCDGGKALVVDESRLTRFQKILFEAHEKEQAAIAEDRRMSAYERKMGY